MKKFRLYIKGTNFLLISKGKPTKHGFYTTRYVEAEAEDCAEKAAVDLIRLELGGKIANKKDDAPIMYVLEIVELESFEDVSVRKRLYLVLRN